MGYHDNFIGSTYGAFRVDRESGGRRKKNKLFWCQCECGNWRELTKYDLTSGARKSCGCLNRAHPDKGSKEYTAWQNMRSRCTNPNIPEYQYYGARGITVCREWGDYDKFLSDMGRANKNSSLGRVDNGGDYCPENCRWESVEQQMKNRSNTVWVEWEGKEVRLIDLCKKFGKDRGIVYGRLQNGWGLSDALCKPIREPEKVTLGDESKTLSEWLEWAGINRETYRYRLDKGWTREQAILTPKFRRNPI